MCKKYKNHATLLIFHRYNQQENLGKTLDLHGKYYYINPQIGQVIAGTTNFNSVAKQWLQVHFRMKIFIRITNLANKLKSCWRCHINCPLVEYPKTRCRIKIMWCISNKHIMWNLEIVETKREENYTKGVLSGISAGINVNMDKNQQTVQMQNAINALPPD